MSAKQYYSVPVTLDEIHRLHFTDSSSVIQYFKKILTSERPITIAPLILFEQDDFYPEELFGIVYDESGEVLHFLYISSRTAIYPLLKNFRIYNKFRLNLPQFEKFKQENSYLHVLLKDKSSSLPMILDKSLLTYKDKKILTSSSLEQQKRNGSNSSVLIDPLANTIMIVLLMLCFYLIRFNKTPDTSFQYSLTQYIKKVENVTKRKKLMRLFHSIQDPENKRFLLKYLQEPRTIDFINEKLQDPEVMLELNNFIQSLPDKKTIKSLKDILYESIARKRLPITITKIKQVPMEQQKKRQIKQNEQQQLFTTKKLYQFLKNNKQNIVSTHGAVSPVFISKLTEFLKKYHAPDPNDIINFLTSQAIRLAKTNKTHRQITDHLLHFITEQRSFRDTSIPPTISPRGKKPPKRKNIKKQTQQHQSSSVIEQEPTLSSHPEWIELVQRIGKTRQSQLGKNVFDANIQNILHGSKTFQKIVPTLCDVIQTRQVRTVYVVDAPNLLTPLGTFSYRKRQQFSKSIDFISILKKHMTMDENSLVLIVSQMNKTEWKKDDPISFGRIGLDEQNIFIVRVGCFDGSNDKDCYLSPNTNFHNECDDFVRLDVMARLLYTLAKEKYTPPTIIHVTNDKNKNWRFLSPLVSQSITPFPLNLH